MANSHRSGMFKRSSDGARVVIGTIMGVVFGFFIGMSFPSVSLNKINLPSSLISSLDVAITDIHGSTTSRSLEDNEPSNVPRIYVSTNPRGAKLLPPRIIVSESDLYLRRLWGEPSEVCGNYGSCLFSKSLAVCMAHDSEH